MSKLHTLLAASTLVALLAACAESPTASPLAPEGARLEEEGGHGMGSGHLDGGVGTFGSGNVFTVSTTSTTTADSGTETAVQEETTDERGGFTGGSGN